MKDRSADPLHHERTLLPRSYMLGLTKHNQTGPSEPSTNKFMLTLDLLPDDSDIFGTGTSAKQKGLYIYIYIYYKTVIILQLTAI